jgi:hypothetical protein
MRAGIQLDGSADYTWRVAKFRLDATSGPADLRNEMRGRDGGRA